MLKLVVTTLKMTPLFEAVTVPFVAQFIDDEGEFVPSEMIDQSARAMLDELVRVSVALAVLRDGLE
jgi:hypothetical protein